MKFQEYSKHYICHRHKCDNNFDISLKDIEVEGKIGGFKGDWIVGLALMAVLVIAFVS